MEEFSPKSRSVFLKHLDPLKEEIKRCENILQKRSFTSNFKKSYKEILDQRKDRLPKRVKNLFSNKIRT